MFILTYFLLLLCLLKGFKILEMIQWYIFKFKHSAVTDFPHLKNVYNFGLGIIGHIYYNYLVTKMKEHVDNIFP